MLACNLQQYGLLREPTSCLSFCRARVLKSLLDREQLFLTDIGKSTCEAAARANMAHEWRLCYAGQLLQPTTIGGLLKESNDNQTSSRLFAGYYAYV